MKHTLSVLVENHAGVLSRISGLFARRGYNIDSLAVGITDDPTISRMTIVVNGDEYILEQVEKQLNKLIDVIRVQRLKESEFVSRELVMFKVYVTQTNRNALMDAVKIMNAKIIDVSTSTVTVEACDTTERLKTLQDLLSPFGIKETVRTGIVAIQTGSEGFKL